MNKQLFYSLGLTKNETKVYLTLMYLGSAQAGQITEKSGIHRRNVYDSLSRLMEKGLVSFVTVNNKKMYSPVNPKRFLDIINEKEYDIGNLRKGFNSIIPELEMMATFKESHDVRFFKGTEGLKSVFEDIIRTGEDYIGYGPINEVKDVLKHHYARFIQKRAISSIRTRLIDGEGTRREKPNRYSKVRYIPQEYISKAALRIYGNKTAIMLLSKDPIAIVIKNQDIADGYRKYFEMMWQSAKK